MTGSGWELVESDEKPDVIVVNTCGFVEQAKKDSIDTLLAASDVDGAKVVAVGCLAERYGKELAEQLPEADAVLGFDAYPELAERLSDVLGGHAPEPHVPVDRRTLLPISPVQRPAASGDVEVPGHAWVPNLARTRLKGGPVANLKLASGCDRRCAFCAIPSFRGSFLSRPPDDVVAEAAWLGMEGVRELVLVSENSTSYGKDLPGGTDTGWRLVASGGFARAGITDRFDGELARSRGLVTAFGTIADPIADKALMGAALIGLSVLGQLAWWVTIVIMVREVGITLLRFSVLRHGIIPASRGGKAKTLVQTVAVGLYVLPLLELTGGSPVVDVVRVAVMAVAIALTVITGFDYVLRAATRWPDSRYGDLTGVPAGASSRRFAWRC